MSKLTGNARTRRAAARKARLSASQQYQPKADTPTAPKVIRAAPVPVSEINSKPNRFRLLVEQIVRLLLDKEQIRSLYRWVLASVVIAFAVFWGGLGLLSMTPPDFSTSRWLVSIACVWVGAAGLLWEFTTEEALLVRCVIGISIGAVVFFVWPQTFGYIARRQQLASQISINATSAPKFDAHIYDVRAGDWPDLPPLPDGRHASFKQPYCMLKIGVANFGAQSSVVRWSAWVTVAHGQRIPLYVFIPPFKIQVSPFEDLLEPQDYIQSKTAPPVTQRDVTIGYLFGVPSYDAEKVTGEQLRAAGTKYEVEFADVDGRVTHTEYTSTGRISALPQPLTPGLSRAPKDALQ
jgi:hypothetical protein